MIERRSFITGGLTAATVWTSGCRTGMTDRPQATRDRALLQREIDEVPADEMEDYFEGNGNWRTLNARYVALARLDAAFDRVVREVREAVVTDRPAVWYLYNMGTVVKTQGSVIGLDICHPRASELEPLLDFATISHNHCDHYTRAFYRQMDRAHKTVFSNFLDNYGAARTKGVVGGFSRGEREVNIRDVTVRTYETDHNPILRRFTMPVEIDCGGYTILHVGDTDNVEDIRPKRPVDLWIHHVYSYGLVSVRGAEHLKPKLTVITHLQELHHARDKWRFTYAQGEDARKQVVAVGYDAVVPLWGDRIV